MDFDTFLPLSHACELLTQVARTVNEISFQWEGPASTQAQLRLGEVAVVSAELAGCLRDLETELWRALAQANSELAGALVGAP
ncbi:MAG: hypothetical protein Q4P06_05600 [Actinomycetaceae bacterium]|nr:hypothetical protein [Actinomycetaceae bacterium]